MSNVSGETVSTVVQDGKQGQATIAESGCYTQGRRVTGTTTTLDMITRGILRARLMKIDVEGAEFQALRGAREFLKNVDCVVYERRGLGRSRVDPVDNLLEEAGFSLRQLDGNNWLAERSVLS